MSRENDLKRQIVRHNRRLQILKEKEATYGLETPVSILTEIADIEAEIKKLSVELDALKQTGGEIPDDVADDTEPASGKRSLSLVWIVVGVLVLAGSVLAVTIISGSIYYILKPDSPATPAESPKKITIDRPQDYDVLPLDESQHWIVEGTYPEDLEHIPDIKVKVLKLPGRQPIPQTGESFGSEGYWRFAPVNFTGEGDYEIIATAYADEKNVEKIDEKMITVGFQEKAAVYENSILLHRKRRGATTPLVLAKPEDVSLDELKEDLYQMQNQFWDFYPDDLDGAQENISKIFDMLDPVLPVFPNDFYLQNVRAYNFKNYALVMRDLNRTEDFEMALDEAESMFEAIRQQDPEDASAWNGLGSVAYERGDYRKALHYIDIALELKPDYPAAIHDRDAALEKLAE